MGPRFVPLCLVIAVAAGTATASAPPSAGDLRSLVAAGTDESTVAELGGCPDVESLRVWLAAGAPVGEDFALIEAPFARTDAPMERAPTTPLAAERKAFRPNPLFALSLFAPTLVGSPIFGPMSGDATGAFSPGALRNPFLHTGAAPWDGGLSSIGPWGFSYPASAWNGFSRGLRRDLPPAGLPPVSRPVAAPRVHVARPPIEHTLDVPIWER